MFGSRYPRWKDRSCSSRSQSGWGWRGRPVVTNPSSIITSSSSGICSSHHWALNQWQITSWKIKYSNLEFLSNILTIFRSLRFFLLLLLHFETLCFFTTSNYRICRISDKSGRIRKRWSPGIGGSWPGYWRRWTRTRRQGRIKFYHLPLPGSPTPRV